MKLVLSAVILTGLLAMAFDPNDPSEGNQWYLDKIDAHEMWDFTTGSTATPARIAVVGGGFGFFAQPVDYDANIQAEVDFTSDGTVRDKCGTFGASTGTGGIIAAETNNNQHIAGIAWTADLYSARAIRENCLVSDADLDEAIDWSVIQGAQVILIDYPASSGTWTASLDAIDDAIAAGVQVVVGTADGTHIGSFAVNNEVILVGGSLSDDSKASYSPSDAAVDLVAPTAGGSPIIASGGCCISNLANTRYAAAQVAAVLGVLRSEGIGRWQALNGVLEGAEDLGTPGEDNDFGAGRLNANCAMVRVADLNGTGDVDLTDAQVITNTHFGETNVGDVDYDVDGTGYIDLADALYVLKFFGAACG